MCVLIVLLCLDTDSIRANATSHGHKLTLHLSPFCDWLRLCHFTLVSLGKRSYILLVLVCVCECVCAYALNNVLSNGEREREKGTNLWPTKSQLGNHQPTWLSFGYASAFYLILLFLHYLTDELSSIVLIVNDVLILRWHYSVGLLN